MAEPQGNVKRKWDQSVALTGATPVVVKAVSSATLSTLFVTRLVLSITSHAAETFVARDSTPTTIAAITDLAADPRAPSVVIWEFATPNGSGDGLQLATGKNLEVLTGATMTGFVVAEGWEITTV